LVATTLTLARSYGPVDQNFPVFILSLDPGVTQVDPVAAHRNSLCEQEFALPPAFRHAAIRADDSMPWQISVGGRKHVSDEPRRAGFDVAVCADKPFWDGAHTADDAGRARLGFAVYARPLHASMNLTLVPTRSTEFE
jgi:hypothetical protein